jgi:hypothetical protein
MMKTVPMRGSVVVVVVVVVVEVAVTTHPVGEHASQQLERALTQACPPRGGVQRLKALVTEHLVVPLKSVRQHVTAPGLPQVDRAAHRLTKAAQLLLLRAARAAGPAQRR